MSNQRPMQAVESLSNIVGELAAIHLVTRSGFSLAPSLLPLVHISPDGGGRRPPGSLGEVPGLGGGMLVTQEGIGTVLGMPLHSLLLMEVPFERLGMDLFMDYGTRYVECSPSAKESGFMCCATRSVI